MALALLLPWVVSLDLLFIQLSGPYHPREVRLFDIALPPAAHIAYIGAFLTGPLGLCVIMIGAFASGIRRPVGFVLAAAGLLSLGVNSYWQQVGCLLIGR
jgi:hypothetical protein